MDSTTDASAQDATHARFQWLVTRAREHPALRMGIVHPCDETSLAGALDAAAAGLVDPVLFGPERTLRRLAESIGRSLDHVPIHAAPDARVAAMEATRAARRGEVAALMKGHMHTADLLHVLLDPEHGLRCGERMSHAFAIDVPGYAHPLVVSDGALHVRPSLEEKRAICRNAIDLAAAIGIEHRRVAVLAAVETVHAAMPATVDAAALAKMAERGQLPGADIDGPLALDNAISRGAADVKHIESRVAGRANILIVPDLEAGNILVKELVLLANAIAAGIVLGGCVPVALTSRSDGRHARVASAALAVLFAAWRRTHGVG